MIRKTAERLNFPSEAIESLSNVYDKLIASEGFEESFAEFRDLIFNGKDRSFLDVMTKIADSASVNRYESHLVLFLLCTPYLKEKYKENGLSEELLYETLSDLRAKLLECKKVHGVYGNFVPFWYGIFYRLEIFKLGRLEYETKVLARDIGDLSMGERVLSCHIPSEGPLTTESVLDSLKRAYEFFPEYRRDGILPVMCHSWLLFPPYRGRVFSESSNIYKFASLFNIVEYEVNENYPDLWRVFDVEYSEGCLSSLPEDTSLQRNLKSFLLDGNLMGEAYGILLFDGEKIVSGNM